MTPLHYAAKYGRLCIVECLVNQKADIDTKDSCFSFKYMI